MNLAALRIVARNLGVKYVNRYNKESLMEIVNKTHNAAVAEAHAEETIPLPAVDTTPAGPVAIDEFVSVLASETARHPLVKDKSTTGIAKRVARHLNEEGYSTNLVGSPRPYFTAKVVLDLFASTIERAESLVAKTG